MVKNPQEHTFTQFPSSISQKLPFEHQQGLEHRYNVENVIFRVVFHRTSETPNPLGFKDDPRVRKKIIFEFEHAIYEVVLRKPGWYPVLRQV